MVSKKKSRTVKQQILVVANNGMLIYATFNVNQLDRDPSEGTVLFMQFNDTKP